MSRRDDYRALHEHAGFLERADLGRLWLRGGDRRSYLHGILTNDIEALAPGEGRYAAVLTAQGRMITDMDVYELGSEVLITLPRSLAAALRDRLDQYIFTEDVQVEDASEATVQFGVYGPAAKAVMDRLDLAPPAVVLAGRPFGVDGFEVVALRGQRDELERALVESGALPVEPATADMARIEAGIPRFLVDMTTDTIPLEAGIEHRAISMTKGCYPGQEVIVRVLHRGGGRVAKKLVGILFGTGAEAPAAGMKVHAGEREIGAITSSAMSERLQRPIALGYVHRDFVTLGTPVTVGGVAAEVAAVPF